MGKEAVGSALWALAWKYTFVAAKMLQRTSLKLLQYHYNLYKTH